MKYFVIFFAVFSFTCDVSFAKLKKKEKKPETELDLQDAEDTDDSICAQKFPTQGMRHSYWQCRIKLMQQRLISKPRTNDDFEQNKALNDLIKKYNTISYGIQDTEVVYHDESNEESGIGTDSIDKKDLAESEAENEYDKLISSPEYRDLVSNVKKDETKIGSGKTAELASSLPTAKVHVVTQQAPVKTDDAQEKCIAIGYKPDSQKGSPGDILFQKCLTQFGGSSSAIVTQNTPQTIDAVIHNNEEGFSLTPNQEKACKKRSTRKQQQNCIDAILLYKKCTFAVSQQLEAISDKFSNECKNKAVESLPDNLAKKGRETVTFATGRRANFETDGLISDKDLIQKRILFEKKCLSDKSKQANEERLEMQKKCNVILTTSKTSDVI